MNPNVSKLVTYLLSKLDGKQREVLENRYGLKTGEVKTLAEIGDKYKVTRERIRQIEAGALTEISKSLPGSGVKEFVGMVKTHLKNMGGLRRENLLLNDLRVMISDPNTQYLANKVHFLLEAAGEPYFALEDKDNHAYWYSSEEDKKKALNLISRVVKFMKENKSDEFTHENMDVVFNQAIKPHNLKDLVALNYISASKQFHVNQFGDFGLSDWPEINPKTMREWAYVILRKHKQPAHFQKISDMINKTRKDAERLAHPQTVHNELIKDERFVLVGRGMYGLQEFGLMPGTAREVIARVLKDNGPLEPGELLQLVLKERLLKKNTVLINLRNKKYFQRLEDGKYTVNTV